MGKRLIAGITIGNCKECSGTGQRRCDVCGGIGEIEVVQPRRSDGQSLAARYLRRVSLHGLQTAPSNHTGLRAFVWCHVLVGTHHA